MTTPVCHYADEVADADEVDDYADELDDYADELDDLELKALSLELS
jgi:hypothetical protein